MAEVIVYHAYNKEWGIKTDTLNVPAVSTPVVLPVQLAQSRPVNHLSTTLLRLSQIAAVLGILIIVINYAPAVYAWASNGVVSASAGSNINLSQTEAQNIIQSQSGARSSYIPPLDPKLPNTNRLIIPAIGVNTQIEEATYDNYESALKEGVWRVSDFGQPNQNSMPTILAAHRYGYLAWTNTYRRENSFYNLPKLAVGDVVEVDWNQRRFLYEVYDAETGTQITDYSADLILYTCVDLTGPERVFRYARLIQN